MEIIPAIDIKEGYCVRLRQGDYYQKTIFSDDPVAIAKQWAKLGAPRLHIVDLDGAQEGNPKNLETIAEIVLAVDIPVQMGGGIRSLEVIEKVLRLGIDRVILGTVAVKNPTLVAEACRRFGSSIVVSLDARNEYIAVKGWQERTGIPVVELLRQLAWLGVSRFIYTDITRDGTLTQPNFESIRQVIVASPRPVMVAGGISSLEHLQRLAQMGVEGAIIGLALYTGAIDLKQALETLFQC